MRIKVNNGGPTRDRSVTSTFPINTSGPFPTINEKKADSFNKLSDKEKKAYVKLGSEK